jgi:23S rRNA pseudouridine1911/1915/1917 synthase
MTTSFEVSFALEGERLDRTVATLGEITRMLASEAVSDGFVRLNGVVVTNRSKRVAFGDVIDVDLETVTATIVLEGDSAVPFAVVYEDDDVIVVNKPAGVVVHPGTGSHTATLVHGLLHCFPDLIKLSVGDRLLRPGIVHRIDKGTSGLLMVARTVEATNGLISQLAAHTVERKYRALAWGAFGSKAGVVDAAIGRSNADPTKMTVSAAGREARTHFLVLQHFTEPEPLTLVECELETGRTHQIRVHMTAIGHPIVGDPTYGGARRSVPLARPFLHAETLGFNHPRTGEPMTFSSELPADLTDLLATLS